MPRLSLARPNFFFWVVFQHKLDSALIVVVAEFFCRSFLPSLGAVLWRYYYNLECVLTWDLQLVIHCTWGAMLHPPCNNPSCNIIPTWSFSTWGWLAVVVAKSSGFMNATPHKMIFCYNYEMVLVFPFWNVYLSYLIRVTLYTEVRIWWDLNGTKPFAFDPNLTHAQSQNCVHSPVTIIFHRTEPDSHVTTPIPPAVFPNPHVLI